jgi:hypothetical protein
LACTIATPHQGRIQGGAPGAPPLKLGKIKYFGVKSWFFTWNTLKISRLPPLGAIFLSVPPPNLKSWIRPCTRQRVKTEILSASVVIKDRERDVQVLNNFKVYFKWGWNKIPFYINSVVFHFDDFNYGRGITTIFCFKLQLSCFFS